MVLLLLDLPPETLEDVLVQSDPLDVAAFAQTCRFTRALVYHTSDQHLWRVLYLAQPLDDPRRCVSHAGRPHPSPLTAPGPDWKRELQRFVRARTVLRHPARCRPAERAAVLQTLLDLVCNVPPRTPGLAFDAFEPGSLNLRWVAGALRTGGFLDVIEGDDDEDSDVEWTEEERQLFARLHVYFGLTPRDSEPGRRVASRAYVYSMRNCTAESGYGPFARDGSFRVNWVHVQAVHHAVSMHLVGARDVGDDDDDEDDEVVPMSMPYIQPVLILLEDSDGQDWAGISGMWRCSFCFCNHQELLGRSLYSILLGFPP